MDPTIHSADEGGVQEGRAVLLHEESAARHEAAAALWDTRHQPGWAEFERRCAQLERVAAQIELARAELERVRARWLKHPTGKGRAETDRLSADVWHRMAQLKVADEELENERDRLRERKQRAHRQPESPARETRIEKDAAEAAPVPPEPFADEPRGTASPNRSARALKERAVHDSTTAKKPSPQGDAAHRAARATQTAVRHTRMTAERLSTVLIRTAAALEESAVLADEHAERRQLAGQRDDAAAERRTAERARAAGMRARSHAAHWLEVSRTGSSETVDREDPQARSTS